MGVKVSISQKSDNGIEKNGDVEEKESDKFITLRDIYKGLWKCRDFELSHLWQRSIFLATFLILVFTGYGKILEIHFVKDSTLCGAVFHLMSLGMAWAGMIISTFWVCMAKGSKAWYERYEDAIGDFVKCFGKNCLPTAFSSPEVAEVAGFEYAEMASTPDWEKRRKKLKRNRTLFSVGAADYSPSRINVAIGHFSFWVWLAVALAHTGAVAYSFNSRAMSWRAALVIAIFGIVAIVPFCAWLASEYSPIASQWNKE